VLCSLRFDSAPEVCKVNPRLAGLCVFLCCCAQLCFGQQASPPAHRNAEPVIAPDFRGPIVRGAVHPSPQMRKSLTINMNMPVALANRICLEKAL
jgi:hypothetical protein